MLRKLLKYDFKANLFYFLLMYGVLMGIAVVARLSIAMADTITTTKHCKSHYE